MDGAKQIGRSLYTLIILYIIIMKKVMVVLSDESYGILKRYQKEGKIANLDTALDYLIREAGIEVGSEVKEK